MPKTWYQIFIFQIIPLAAWSVSFQSPGNTNPVAVTNLATITLDGLLTEADWEETLQLDGFRQILPEQGGQPTERTEVYLFHDEDYLYLGARLYHSLPEEVFASVMERDQVMDSDDFFTVIIDTYNDRTSALVFQTNPLGARTDYELFDLGTEFGQNFSWNAFWDAKASRTEFGWSTEIRIPLSTLRYEVADQNIMGFKFIRNIRSKSERLLLPFENVDNARAELSLQSTQEIAFQGLTSKTPIYVAPYTTAQLAQSAELNMDGSAYEATSTIYEGKGYVAQPTLDRILSNQGLDIKIRLHSNHTLDVTLNTDFAQAEADDRILNLTRFSIALPEKRPFFLENADLLAAQAFEHIFFHSRRIGIEEGQSVPLAVGARLTGMSKGIQYGLLNMQSQGIPDLDINPKNFTVLRLKQNLREGGSYLAGLITNIASGSEADQNTMANLDGLIHLNNNTWISFFVAGSRAGSRIGDEHYAWGLRVARFPANGWEFDYLYREYQEHFLPGLGFLSRPDTRQLKIRNGYSRTYQNHPWLARLAVGSYISRYWLTSTGAGQFLQINPYLYVRTRKGNELVAWTPLAQWDRLFEPWTFVPEVVIPAGLHQMDVYNIIYRSGRSKKYWYVVDMKVGGFYGGWQIGLTPDFNYVINRHVKLAVSASYNRFLFPDEYYLDGDQNVVARTVLYGRLDITVTPQLSLKTFLQYQSDDKLLTSNIRLRYNPSEGRDLYLVFNFGHATDRSSWAPIPPPIIQKAVIVKYSHIFMY